MPTPGARPTQPTRSRSRPDTTIRRAAVHHCTAALFVSHRSKGPTAMNPTPDDPDPAPAEGRPPPEVPSSSRTTKPRAGNDTLAEHAATDYLQRGGMRILDRNWRCPEGKIDIVAAEHRVLVVCQIQLRPAARANASSPDEPGQAAATAPPGHPLAGSQRRAVRRGPHRRRQADSRWYERFHHRAPAGSGLSRQPACTQRHSLACTQLRLIPPEGPPRGNADGPIQFSAFHGRTHAHAHLITRAGSRQGRPTCLI